MKKIYAILAITTLFLISSCTEVVKVDLNTANPKLVVEASIVWNKGTTGNVQKIKLTTTTDFYTNVIPVVSGATVFVKNSSNMVYNFVEFANSGDYICSNFVPVINETYQLNISANGNNYTATETLKPVATIVNVAQENIGGLSGNKPVLKANFIDPATQENYYFYRYTSTGSTNPNNYVAEDAFFNGNPFFSSTFGMTLNQGDQVKVTHFGISKKYFNYLNILLDISGNQGGGPFQSPPVSVRGNIINANNSDNFPLGFFSLSEADSRTISVQ